MSELRKDPISARWVIIAPERARNPFGSRQISTNTNKESNREVEDLCPFCPGNEELTGNSILHLPENKNWKVRAFANKFPSLKVEGDLNREAKGMYDYISGIGAHEIIVDTCHHGKGISSLDTQDIEFVFQAYQSRILDLFNDRRLRYIQIYKNHGNLTFPLGEHSHTQLIATPVIPDILKTEYKNTRKYFANKERCLFCDLLNQERESNERIVTENKDFVLFCPYASQLPFEIQIYPKRHSHDFSGITPGEIKSLSEIVKDALVRLDTALKNPAYSMTIHSGPNRRAFGVPGKWQTIQFDYHWHIEIFPKISVETGFEFGSGLLINPSLPEEIAKYLKNIPC